MVLYAMEGLDCTESAVGSDIVERFWVRIKGQANVDIIVEGY